MSERVLVEKVRRPDSVGLARPRLELRLVGADKVGLALVVAPPGSGKTTLLAQVANLSGLPAAWYTVGPEDGSPAAFVGHMAHALAAVTPVVDPLTESLDDLLISVQAAPGSLLLVVDDLHEISGTKAEPTLERLVRLRPRHLTVLLGSRRTPAINTPRLLASGALVEVGVDDLRFRSWEVEELYRRVYRQPLSPESAAALTRRTEGWAAGLQLFHLSTSGKDRAQREAAVADLSGRSRLIRSYLASNVIAELPVERRDFLMRTATLGALTGSLCDELLGTTGSESVLAELERSHFFTTSTDDGRSFRYHQVLSSHLEVLALDVLGAVETRKLYTRSADILERGGQVQAAARAYARAEEWGSVARLVRQNPSELDGLEVPAPASLSRHDPWIALSHARRLVRQGDIRQAVASFAAAGQLCEDGSLRVDCGRASAMAGLWLAPADMATGPPTGMTNGGSVSATATGTWLTSSTSFLVRQATIQVLPGLTTDPIPPLAETLVQLLAGRFDEARDVMARVTAAGTEPEWQVVGLRLVAILVGLADGTELDANRRLEDLALTAELGGHAWLAKITRGVQSCVLTVEGATPTWSGGSTDAASACQAEGDRWGEVVLGLVAGVALLRQGKHGEAVSVLEGVAVVATSLGAPVLALWASALAGVAADTGMTISVGTAALDAQALALGVTGIRACADVAPSHARLASTAPKTPTSACGLPIELSCLGGLRLRVGGADVALTDLRPRARTLLQILAVAHGRDVHREKLIDVLWPEASVAAGTHRLHVAASSIRRFLTSRACGESSLLRHDDAYRLALPNVVTDVARFENGLQAMSRSVTAGSDARAFAAGMQALDVYVGDLLPEVGPAEWVLPERDRLRTLASSAAITLARLAQRLGRPEDGWRTAQRAVELDPLRDTAWLLLAEHQEALGEPSAAAVTRREHRRIVSVLQAPG